MQRCIDCENYCTERAGWDVEPYCLIKRDGELCPKSKVLYVCPKPCGDEIRCRHRVAHEDRGSCDWKDHICKGCVPVPEIEFIGGEA